MQVSFYIDAENRHEPLDSGHSLVVLFAQHTSELRFTATSGSFMATFLTFY